MNFREKNLFFNSPNVLSIRKIGVLRIDILMYAFAFSTPYIVKNFFKHIQNRILIIATPFFLILISFI